MGVILEAGYQFVSDIPLDKSIKITEKIYFKPILLPYPKSECLNDEEIKYFCAGLWLISKSLSKAVQEGFYLVIGLRSISFSECYIQIEDFTGCAILWASEIFNIPMPDVNVYLDSWKSEFLL